MKDISDSKSLLVVVIIIFPDAQLQKPASILSRFVFAVWENLGGDRESRFQIKEIQDQKIQSLLGIR